jgi:hypothetical protein
MSMHETLHLCQNDSTLSSTDITIHQAVFVLCWFLDWLVPFLEIRIQIMAKKCQKSFPLTTLQFSETSPPNFATRWQLVLRLCL